MIVMAKEEIKTEARRPASPPIKGDGGVLNEKTSLRNAFSLFRCWCLHIKSRNGIHPSEGVFDLLDGRNILSGNQ